MEMDLKEQYDRNRSFFTRKYPNIGNAISNHSVDTKSEEQLSLLYQSYLEVGAVDNTSNEDESLSQFRQLADTELKKSSICSYQLPDSDLYYYPRLFMQAMSKMIDSFQIASPIDKSKGRYDYRCDGTIPLLLLFGVPTKRQLNYLLTEYSVVNLVIMEPDFDKFIASLLIMDWEEVDSAFRSVGQSLHFLFGGQDDQNTQFGLCWNFLIRRCPIFPLQTFYLATSFDNTDKLEAIKARVVQELNVYLSGWGNYDDEINQLRQALYNITVHSGSRRIDHLSSIPSAVIVGSGPSLDKKIKLLKSAKERMMVVSCATSLTVLHKYGVVPDLHVHIESDYVGVEMLKAIDDDAYLAQIPLIAPVQVAPSFLNYFKTHLCYLKSGGILAQYFSELYSVVESAGPNCVNHALQILKMIGCQEVYLMGVDLGFADTDNHHSKASIYYKEDAHQLYKDGAQYKGRKLIKREGRNGAEVFTDPFMDASRIYLERFLAREPKMTVYNLSEGVRINGTLDITDDEALVRIVKKNPSKYDLKSVNLAYRSGDLKPAQDREIEARFRSLNNNLLENIQWFSDEIKGILFSESESTGDQMIQQCISINNKLERELRTKAYAAYLLVRGSYYHFMSVGLSHYLTTLRSRDSSEVVEKIWRESIADFGERMIEHLESAVEVGSLPDLESVSRSISTAE